MRHAIATAAAVLLLAGLSGSALAQAAPPPQDEPTTGAIAPGDDAMTDVDPETVARCSAEATARKLQGSARKTFLNDCAEPED